MRGRRAVAGLAFLLTPVFLVVSLFSELAAAEAAPARRQSRPERRPARLQALSVTGGSPLALPEDPLGQDSRQQIPEISIQVDVRDGHVTVRVVDIWGPRRVPLVVRSWTGAAASPSGAGYWQFNHHLDAAADASSAVALEPDGNQAKYTGSSGSYVKDIGTYSTLSIPFSQFCAPGGPGDPGRECDPPTWGTTFTVGLPKGVTRKFGRYSPDGQASVSGLITEERDANNNVASFAWTALAEQDKPYVATVTDPVGRVTSYGYEGYRRECAFFDEEFNICRAWRTFYRVASVTDPSGRRATYAYNAAGQIASVTNAAGFTTSYGYDAAGRLTSVTNPRNLTTTIAWTPGPDGPARVASVTSPDTTVTRYSYPTTTRTIVTDTRSNATTYDLASGDVVTVTDPLASITRYAYDARHNLTQVTDARGIITTYTYNTRNKVTQIVQASGILNLTTTLSWDGVDNLLSVTNPRGIRTDYTYNPTHNLTSVRRAVGTVDEALTQFTYTAWGGVASMTDPRGNITNYAYTLRRQMQSVTPPAGGVTTFGYDAFDDQVSTTNGNGRTWSTAFNARRQVTSVTDPLTNRVSYEYDANGNQTRVIDGKLQATSFAYNSRDRLISITDPSMA